MHFTLRNTFSNFQRTMDFVQSAVKWQISRLDQENIGAL